MNITVNKESMRIKIFKTFIIVVIVLFVLVVIVSLYPYFSSSKANSYKIENKYYGFQLQAPKGWTTLENTNYYEASIAPLMDKCSKEKGNIYEVGAIRIESQKYPQDLVDSGNLPTETKSGAILEVTANCYSDDIKLDLGEPSDVAIKGVDKTFVSFFDLPGFGKTKRISFYHDNLQYGITEYVYVSLADKNQDNAIREEYVAMFEKVISSLNFTK